MIKLSQYKSRLVKKNKLVTGDKVETVFVLRTQLGFHTFQQILYLSGIREDAAETPGGAWQEAEDEHQHREEADQRGLTGKTEFCLSCQKPNSD